MSPSAKHSTRFRLTTLVLTSLFGSFVLACATVTDQDSRPLVTKVPVEGCAAAGDRNNTIEARPSPGLAPPNLDHWEANMVEYGRRLGDEMLAESAFSARLNMSYYDGQRVFLQIADYTGEEEPWTEYARIAEETYKTYLERNDFRAAGHMRFPHGLFMDWQRNGDSQSREYLLLLRERAAFSHPGSPKPRERWRDARYSREIAYALETQVLAERAGGSARARRSVRRHGP